MGVSRTGDVSITKHRSLPLCYDIFHILQLHERMQTVAQRVQDVQKQCQVGDREDDVTLSLRNGLMRVVYEWANGMVGCCGGTPGR